MSHKCGIKGETRSHKEKRWLSEVLSTHAAFCCELGCVVLRSNFSDPGTFGRRFRSPRFQEQQREGVKYGRPGSGFSFHGSFYWPLKVGWIVSGSQKTLMHGTELLNPPTPHDKQIVSSSSKKAETKSSWFWSDKLWEKANTTLCSALKLCHPRKCTQDWLTNRF